MSGSGDAEELFVVPGPGPSVITESHRISASASLLPRRNHEPKITGVSSCNQPVPPQIIKGSAQLRNKFLNSHFKTEGQFRVCTLCKKKYKLTTSTSNLGYHLKNAHSLLDEEPHKESSVVSWVTTKPRLTKERSDEITKWISNWITEDLLEPSKVMGNGFRKLIESLQPNYKIPDRQTFMRTIIPEDYRKLKVKIQHLLSNSTSKKAVTADLWTDHYRKKHYIGLTAHFVLDWKLYSFVLATQEFKTTKTGENISIRLTEITEQWGIVSPNIVTDNGSAELLAVRILGWNGFRCTAHLLNLVVRDVLDDPSLTDLKLLVEKFRKIVHHFIYKGSRYEAVQHHFFQTPSDELLEEMDAMGDEDTEIVASHTTLKRDVATRWNSILTMMRSVLETRSVVKRILCEDECYELVLKDEEIVVAKTVIDFLSFFEAATVLMSGERYASISMVIPSVVRLKKACCLNASDVTLMVTVKSRALTSLGARFDSALSNEIYLAATCLDPRFLMFVRSTGFPGDAHAVLNSLLEKREVAASSGFTVLNNETEAPAQKKSKFCDFFEDICGAFPTAPTSQRDEVTKYLLLPQLTAEEEHSFKLLDWWSTQEANFRRIAKLAKDVLAIPATSVPTERAFSGAGNIVTAKRSRLLPENVEMLLFVFHNKKSLKAQGNS